MASIQLGIFVHVGDLGAFLTEPDQQLTTNVGMRHLTTAEPNRHLHPVALFEKLLGIFDFDVKVVGVDAGGHADFFDLSDVLILLRFFFFLCLLEAELAIVHDLADGGIRAGRDLHQVHTLIIGHIQRVLGGHDAELFAIGSDHADLLVSDVLIELMVLFGYGKHLQRKNADAAVAPA